MIENSKIKPSDFTEAEMNEQYQANNIFAKILKGEAPCIKLFEDDYTLAFMDIMPQKEGHALVIPKQAATTIYDLTDQASLACMKTVQKVSKAVEQALNVQGTSIVQHNGNAAGQTVPHFHFHIIPGSLHGLKAHAEVKAEPEHIEKVAQKIKAYI